MRSFISLYFSTLYVAWLKSLKWSDTIEYCKVLSEKKVSKHSGNSYLAYFCHVCSRVFGLQALIHIG